MKNSSQALPGALSALLLALIVMGSILLSMIEGDLSQAIASGAVSPLVGAVRSGFGINGLNKLQARSTPFLPDAISSTTGLIEAPLDEIPCLNPMGWVVYIIQADDTLDSLANKFGVQSQTLAQNNCMDPGISHLIADTTLFIPGEMPTVTATRPPRKVEPRCGPPAGWVIYTVRPGDTLYSLSRLVGASIAQLQQANCMGSSTLLRAGQGSYVPHLPPRPTATRTPVLAPTLTNPAPATETQPPASYTPSSTPSGPPPSTPQPPAPSNTPVIPSPTSSPMPTNTTTITPSPIVTHQPTNTPTVPAPPYPPPGALFFVLLFIFLKFIMT